MRLLFVGKFPPIQGGVSARMYHYAHGLARRGHTVHVVTNALEVRAPYRMFMRDVDWARCDGSYGDGSVTVHGTDPMDASQAHVPMHSAFATKLAGVGLGLAAEEAFDAVFSFYMEPYGIAGHLISQAAGLPHVVKVAGSDAGKLWNHDQFRPLFDHVFRSAAAVIAAGPIRKRLKETGVDEHKIVPEPESFTPLDWFTPDGPSLDIEELGDAVKADAELSQLFWGTPREDLTYVGMFGKLGSAKGTFALLEAVRRLADEGSSVGLLVMGHDRPRSAHDFRATAIELRIADRIVQIPFLPHWRVPEFIRRCAAVCCLEQGFPIKIHRPVAAFECLASGALLIGATEILNKLPSSDRIVHGYNCLAVRDVEEVGDLADAIRWAIDTPEGASLIGARGRAYAEEVAASQSFPGRLEAIFEASISNGIDRSGDVRSPAPFTLTWQAFNRLSETDRAAISDPIVSPPGGEDWVKALCSLIVDGGPFGADFDLLADCARIELLIEGIGEAVVDRPKASMFRLGTGCLGLAPETFPDLVVTPVSGPRKTTRTVYDANELLDCSRLGILAETIPGNESFVLAMPGSTGRILVLDSTARKILDLCEFAQSVAKIEASIACDDNPSVDVRDRIERLFILGVVSLTEPDHDVITDRAAL